MRYGSDYQGLETSDSIIAAIEELHNGRACDKNSNAWMEWSDPDDINGIVARAWEIEVAGDNQNQLYWGVETFDAASSVEKQ